MVLQKAEIYTVISTEREIIIILVK